ncbi:hypothetical protein OSB04_013826 [Centaurea solstitialis]|uniref:RING-type E3 ubiquitin transferase n=1 Tax=Centaurea solstitialis TaxID=347529 RepID=A0AA38TX12_9ASTR|nr:hypothetical protein OSB04_013826 [Centaurea solstitialis]
MNHIKSIKTPFIIFLFFKFFVFHVFGQRNSPESAPDVVHPVHSSVVIIIGILCAMFCLAFLILACLKFCNSDVTLQPVNGILTSRSRFSGIDKKTIESLPFFRFSSLKGSKEGLECVVCLSRFEDSEVLRLLPKCRHAFHVNCIDQWLESHSSCPLCRYKFDVSDVTNIVCTNSLRYPQDDGLNINNLEIFVKRESDHSSRSSRFSIGNKFKPSPNPKDDVLIQYGDRRLLDKFKHRIIVSDIVGKSRWSDVNSSDLMLLNSKMLNEVSSRRFSPLGSGRFEIDIDIERVSKAGKTGGETSVSGSEIPRFTENKVVSEGLEKRSMSEITNFSRFRESRGSYWTGSGKEDRVQSVWLPMAKRTIHWFTNRERNSLESRT